jgi:hypothetical protein
MGDDASRLRQLLRGSPNELARQLEFFLAERGPLIRGSFGSRARVCGAPGCRCARGELHESKYLTASDGGRVRQIHVPAGDEVRVAAGAQRYRRFQSQRARLARELAKLVRRQLELIDALGRSLLEPYPADHPLPPATRRGRTPRKGQAGG